MKVSIIGSRGIPARYGGFETFAEEISLLLANEGYEVIVQCDKENPDAVITNPRLSVVKTKCSKSEQPLRYYFEGIVFALKNSDVVIVTSAGGAIFYPLNLFYRKILITNPDGVEYQRQKWSLFKRFFLRFSETIAMIFSDFIVADSLEIGKLLESKYPRLSSKIRIIAYGAHIPDVSDSQTLKKFNLVKDMYYLVVCRLEPDNNLEMIIHGFLASSVKLPLVIIGNLETKYSKWLISEFKSDRILFKGAVYNKSELNVLRKECKGYIHGHSVGGTNPSLLESMASGNIIIAHDNLFNREVTNNSQLYFSGTEECTKRIEEAESFTDKDASILKMSNIKIITERYTWSMILRKYTSLLNEAVSIK